MKFSFPYISLLRLYRTSEDHTLCLNLGWEQYFDDFKWGQQMKHFPV